MKRGYFLFAMFLTTLCLALISCQNDDYGNLTTDGKNTVLPRTFTFDASGDVHNNAIDSVESDWENHDWENINNSDKADTLVSIVVPIIQDQVDPYSGVTASSINTAVAICDAIADPDDFQVLVDTTVARLNRTNEHTSSELFLLSRMLAVFELDFSSKTNIQIAQQVIDSFEVYTEEIENNPTLYTHLDFLAMAYVGLGSANYWYTVASTPPGDIGGGPMGLIIQIDCAGYLAGWAASWWNEVNSPGYSNDWPDARRRIGNGVIAAATASSFKRWFG